MLQSFLLAALNHVTPHNQLVNNQHNMAAKRQRSSNMTDAERCVLADLTHKYKNVIENKKTDSCSSKAKELAWTRLADEFSVTSTSAVQRDSSQLKHVRT